LRLRGSIHLVLFGDVRKKTLKGKRAVEKRWEEKMKDVVSREPL
jgi:hypothetical protein